MVSLASSGSFQGQTEANVSWVSEQDLQAAEASLLDF